MRAAVCLYLYERRKVVFVRDILMARERGHIHRKRKGYPDRRVISHARTPLVIRPKPSKPACSNYVQHMQAESIASNNRELVQANSYLLTCIQDLQQEKLSLENKLLMYQATVKDAFTKQLNEGKDKLVLCRNQLGSTIRESLLKPMDEVIDLLHGLNGEVITFQSPGRISGATVILPTATIRRSSFEEIRRFSRSPVRQPLSAAEVKENRQSSGLIRPRKIITPDIAPLTPLLEMSSLLPDNSSPSDVSKENVVNVTFSPQPVVFSPKQTSTERKSKRIIRTEKAARPSIFNFTPATPRPCTSRSSIWDPDITLLAENEADVQDATLSAAHMNLSLLQESFMDHASFRERFGNGVNGRSTEISESSIDETPPVQRNNFRTIRSSCFGDLTDSPQSPSCSPLMAGGESSHAPKGLHDSSHNVVISPPASACPEPEERETPLKGKIGKRKRAAPKEPMAKKSSVTVEKNMSQSGARTLSLSNSDNYTTMNSTAVVDQAADTSTSSRDRPRRARKEVSYKEPPLAGKLRRN